MKQLKINIVKVESGYICQAKNGEMPFEGRVHPSKVAAYADLDAAYRNNTWRGHKTKTGYQITTD